MQIGPGRPPWLSCRGGRPVRVLPGGFPAAYGGKNGSLLLLNVAEGNRETPSFSGRADVTGLELNYDGPSYIHDDTSVLISARHLEFERLFDLIGQNTIGAPTLTDVIFKSVSRLSARHTVEFLGVYAPEDYARTIDNGRSVHQRMNPSILSEPTTAMPTAASTVITPRTRTACGNRHSGAA